MGCYGTVETCRNLFTGSLRQFVYCVTEGFIKVYGRLTQLQLTYANGDGVAAGFPVRKTYA